VRKTLITAVALVAIATAFAAVAAGGTHSAGQRVRIEVKGILERGPGDPFTFVLTPISPGGVGLLPDSGSATLCCWTNSSVTRAGAKLEVSNPLLTIGTKTPWAVGPNWLKIRERVEWVDLPDRWSVCTGTWKVVGGSGAYAGLSGHGRVACAWGPDPDFATESTLRVRLFGFLAPNW
jgi:hypothetical protein